MIAAVSRYYDALEDSTGVFHDGDPGGDLERVWKAELSDCPGFSGLAAGRLNSSHLHAEHYRARNTIPVCLSLSRIFGITSASRQTSVLASTSNMMGSAANTIGNYLIIRFILRAN